MYKQLTKNNLQIHDENYEMDFHFLNIYHEFLLKMHIVIVYL